MVTDAGFPFHTIATSKKTNKRREREEKNNRRESLRRSNRTGGDKKKQEQKNKSKDPPRISERQINKQERQTKCQDHTTVDTVRESLSTPHQSLGGGSGQSSVEIKGHQYSNAKNHPLLFCGIQRHHGSSNGKVAKSSFAWRALVSFTRLVDQADMKTSAPSLLYGTTQVHLGRPSSNTWGRFRRQCSIPQHGVRGVSQAGPVFSSPRPFRLA